MSSIYREIGYGASGSAVKKLQNVLNSHGYQLEEDGIFGKKTKAAVRDYQKKNSLKIDGIVGDETWGSLLGQSGVMNAAAQEMAMGQFQQMEPVEPVPTVSGSTAAALKTLEAGFVPSADSEAAGALAESLEALRPDAYVSSFEGQLSALYQEIADRPAFTYDPEEDAAFQSFAAQYSRMGKDAMEDTMARAAHLTGGYGSSYAQSVGSQAYYGYMDKLSDMMPQLRSEAYARYAAQGDALLSRYELLAGQEKEAYARWQEDVAAWRKEVEKARESAQDLRDDELKSYEMMLDYFSDKANAEAKGLSTAHTSSAALSSIGNSASLSSTGAQSLQRAMENYLKAGQTDKATALLGQYSSRMTPAQKQKFEALFTAYRR